MNLTNKTALITGASSGIGKSFAYLLAAKGANLVLVARSKDQLETISNELESEYGIMTHVLSSDLGQPNAGQNLYTEIKKQNISVDLLINNAGFGKWGRFEDFTLDEYSNMMQLNMFSLTELCYLFLEDFKQKQEAGIINVGSTASFMPIPFSAVYAATKSYVLSLSESLTGELAGTNIQITCLCPSGTESNFNKVANSNNDKDIATNKLMSSDEVAQQGLDAFLAKKHYVITGRTGQISLLKFLPRKKVITMVANYWKKRLGYNG
ncbi:MAG: hypothetical protein CMB80_11265 [Flammeovirgaceae bacterium]|nr:hypothetical protein [Flammeovirgaceae bacterium]MBE60951.1 hypothetical protein [Flammeovirgaceae bacterium]HCX23809.1 hypothetical protein [Cytophagales bacterium]|tara:strand:+ start:1492 stop:2289 length:798 start_codon:yes stop_codon:yes gene_type:complete